jgi:hypothetical protein
MACPSNLSETLPIVTNNRKDGLCRAAQNAKKNAPVRQGVFEARRWAPAKISE